MDPRLLLIPVAALAGLAWFLGFRAGWRRGERSLLPATTGEPLPAERLEAMARARDAAEEAKADLQRTLVVMEMAAGIDRLTGAWNRRRFEEGAAGMMALAARKREPLVLLCLDVDGLRSVNEAHGQGAGDQLLVQLAQVLKGRMRASDTLTRWAGGTFMVLAPGTYLPGAVALAEKLREAAGETEFAFGVRASLSIGLVEHRPGESLAEWTGRAQQALLEAKEAGRDRVVTLGGAVLRAPGREGGAAFLELRWDPGLECGELALDNEHRELFDMINALLANFATFPEVTEVGLRLQTFQAHLAQHFRNEEALLETLEYPKLASHAHMHKTLIIRASKLRAELMEGRLGLGQVLGFLSMEVVRDHLLLEDRDFFPLIRASGRGMQKIDRP